VRNYLPRAPHALLVPDLIPRARAAARGARAFLVAAQGAAHPAAWMGGEPLQQMRIVFVLAGGAGGLRPRERLVASLPQLSAAAIGPDSPARPVRGELLRGANGALYERTGDAIRPLGQLATAPDGSLLDVANPEAADVPVVQPSCGAQVTHYRALLPGEGTRRVVRLGEFKTMLAPQLDQAGRLRDNHQLAVKLQIYEAASDIAARDLAQWITGKPTNEHQFGGWTAALSHRFRLALPPTDGARFFRLQVAIDPTASAALEAPQAAVQPRTTRTSIPERFMNPWEFRLAREEAAYDMHRAGTQGAWRSLVRRLANRASRADLEKWRALLSGKPADEQLWGIPPPRRGLAEPAVRAWAERTLREAGFDPGSMLAEWEIYWRRKGLT
jgi:hypothetical protein